jgi:class 3 adenylate cyclase
VPAPHHKERARAVAGATTLPGSLAPPVAAYDSRVSPTAEDVLVAGRDALDRHAWDEAYDTLDRADRQDGLPPEGLQLLAEAAWFSSRPDVVLDVLERASKAYLDAGDHASAAMMAFRAAEQHLMRLEMPMAGGWIARAEQLAAGDPAFPVHGYLAYAKGSIALQMHDFEAAAGFFDEAMAIASRTGDRDLYAKSLHDKGRSLCWQGRFAEGLRLMDEAMVAAVAGDLKPPTAGYVYCSMIDVCSRLGDYRRSAEWTEATARLCERLQIPGFTGICRVHQAELLRLHGDWSHAEEQATLACDEMPKSNFVFGIGFASYAIAEVRRMMGDLDAAEALYGRAHEYGLETEPGLSLLRMAQGKLAAAAAGVRRALTEEGNDPVSRLKLLVAQADIAVAADDVETAASASRDLDALVKEHEAPALHAAAAGVRGAVRLAQGHPEEAIAELRRAREGWQEVDAPYEIAEVRVLLGRAYHATGEDEAAVLELKAANTTFERLGASLAAGSTSELLGEVAAAGQAPERLTRAFMFTDIVGSTDLVGVIGDEAWENLLAWHDHTLRSLFASHGGEVAHHTGDGFFVAFPDARSALTSAVAVQRALEEHRRSHGFSPRVRIGVHVAEATRRGRDYSGGEVHKAARIAAAAEGDEILASAETAAATDGMFPASEPREVAAKGIPHPVQVVGVEWRPPGRSGSDR